MRHFLVIAIAWGAIQFEAGAPAYAADAICPMQALGETSQNEQRRIVLSTTAQRQADCSYRNKKTPSLEGLVQDKVLNWWVLHSPDEDYRVMTTIAERNQAILGDAHLRKSKDDDFRKFEFLGVELENLLRVFSYTCYDNLRSNNGPRIYISAFQNFKGPVQESCLGLAVILAAQGISLKKEGEYIVPSVASWLMTYMQRTSDLHLWDFPHHLSKPGQLSIMRYLLSTSLPGISSHSSLATFLASRYDPPADGSSADCR